ncbi:MAG: type B 50S ribosomal protein L31 [Actinomadura rubrobrunea]|nr:type B 50S ribosomal protein L31 [Actinomadura rubrobrunea]
MKQGIHPEYRPVVFRDRGAGVEFVTRSAVVTDRTTRREDGTVLPLVDVDVSAASHPYYTGRGRILDTTGAVERYRRRYGGRTR